MRQDEGVNAKGGGGVGIQDRNRVRQGGVRRGKTEQGGEKEENRREGKGEGQDSMG